MRPITFREINSSVFLHEQTQEGPQLNPYWSLRVKTELDISAGLDLFFVSKATSDFAAVAITYPKIRTVRAFT